MKKFIVLAIIVIAAYFIFGQTSSFENDLNFNRITYSHVKEMRGGEITNHFYTPNGEEFNTAKSFIQVIEISEAMRESNWQDRLEPLYTQYQLSPVEDQPLELAGNIQKSGFFFNSYAALIEVQGKDHMAFYVIITNDEYINETTSDKRDIINQLKRIGDDLN